MLGLTAAEITAQCIAELTVGQPLTDELWGRPNANHALAPTPADAEALPVRAGMLKAGLGYWSITAFEARVIEGIATAHRATGAPVMIHLEHGTCAHEALDLLAAAGVESDRVVLAHIDRSPDPILYAELASRGAYLGCDGAARLKDWPESVLIDAIERACAAGHGDRVLLGGDVARSSRYRAYGGTPGIAYLTARFTPRLTSQVGEDTMRAFLTNNPQRLLAWSAFDQ